MTKVMARIPLRCIAVSWFVSTPSLAARVDPDAAWQVASRFPIAHPDPGRLPTHIPIQQGRLEAAFPFHYLAFFT
ncbi:unnamed protein product [Stenotrophomonas maltophilia]|nr:unnamed protein product [Stenotrophomonas maltophilia]